MEKQSAELDSETDHNSKFWLKLQSFVNKLKYKNFIKENLPMQLTYLRILLIPFYVLLAPWGYSTLNYLAAIVFIVAALTDYFDGFFARKFNQTSSVGAVLDHLSDKALIVSAIIVLASRYPFYLPIFVVIVLREILVLGLREISVSEKSRPILVSGLGKVKTFVLDLGVVGLTIGDSKILPSAMEIGFLALFVGAGISVYSGWGYFNTFKSLSVSSSNKQDTNSKETETEKI